MALYFIQSAPLESRDGFSQGVSVRCSEQIDKALKTEMKWDCDKIDIGMLRDVVGWHRHFVGHRNGIPNAFRLIIPDLNAIGAALRNSQIGIHSHRFDRRAHLQRPIASVNAEMNLSIDRYRLCEQSRPIDAPIGEDRARIARDRE